MAKPECGTLVDNTNVLLPRTDITRATIADLTAGVKGILLRSEIGGQNHFCCGDHRRRHAALMQLPILVPVTMRWRSGVGARLRKAMERFRSQLAGTCSAMTMRGPVPYRLGALLWALLGGLY